MHSSKGEKPNHSPIIAMRVPPGINIAKKSNRLNADKNLCSILSILQILFLHPFPNLPIPLFPQLPQHSGRPCPHTPALRTPLRRRIRRSHILHIGSKKFMPALRAFECRHSSKHRAYFLQY